MSGGNLFRGVLLLAAWTPCVASVICTTFLVEPDTSAVALPHQPVECDDQPVSLRALAHFRAPPALAFA